MRDFAFVQTDPGRLFVGWGPFEQLPFRRPERPAFYVTDFFLDDPHPWRHPAEWEEIATDEFASRFAASAPLKIDWDLPSADEFAALFDAARHTASMPRALICTGAIACARICMTSVAGVT